MGPVEPIGRPPQVTRPLRVTRERREREPDDPRRRPAPEEASETAAESDEDADGHIDVTV
jgi:hypothetical protein